MIADLIVVSRWCIARTNIDIDDQACDRVMKRYGFTTKRDAVNFALRQLAIEPFSIEEALAMEGTGWDGNLDEMREGRVTTTSEPPRCIGHADSKARQFGRCSIA